MKIIFTLILLLTGKVSHTQSNFNMHCYEIIGNDTTPVECDESFYGKLPTPIFYGNIDSLCWEMEKRFVETLNEWRRNHGINELEYDSEMESLLTVPWNKKQVRMGKISHGEGYNSLGNRSDRVGIGGVGECCAYNHRSDMGEVSRFFIQYKDSPPHWKILTDDEYDYISVSVLYDQEINRYYSVVNVRW